MHRGSGAWRPFSSPTLIEIIYLQNNADGYDTDGNSVGSKPGKHEDGHDNKDQVGHL